LSARHPLIYCIVARDAALKLHDKIRAAYEDDPSIEVILERRRRSRRARGDQRRGDGESPPVHERRKIRNASGRRIGERRAEAVAVEPPRLPRKVARHSERVRFVQRLEPGAQQSEDMSTSWLVVRFQAGDRSAFDELYMRYFDRVYTYLRVALRDSFEAEDAAQQVFLKVLEALPGYERRRQPFRAWLFRIARNQAVDMLRRKGMVELEDPIEIGRRYEDAGEETDLRALSWMSDSELLIPIERLPPLQRQVIVLRFMVDLSTADIAAIVGRSPEAVRQIQSRALAFLRARLESLGGEPVGRTVRLPMTLLPRRSPVLLVSQISPLAH
jgi:RNA polymerase sigma-70 factor (ECF subfamily)